MRIRMSIVTASLFAVSLAAHADTIVTFDASGIFQSGSVLSGTLTMDTTTGIIDAVDLVVSAPDSLTFDGIKAQNCTTAGTTLCQTSLDTGVNANPRLHVVLGDGTLVGYDGANLGSVTNPIDGYDGYLQFLSGSYDWLESGSLTPEPSPTPEPSSLVLLGTGALGLIDLARRRLA